MFFFFFQAEDGIRDIGVTGVQTCALPISTLLADWLREPAAASRPVAWLALDAGDADPLMFLRYLIAALQTIDPIVGRSVLALLGSGQAPPLKIGRASCRERV